MQKIRVIIHMEVDMEVKFDNIDPEEVMDDAKYRIASTTPGAEIVDYYIRRVVLEKDEKV